MPLKLKWNLAPGYLTIAMLLIAGSTASAQMPFYGNYYLHDPGTLIKDGTNYFIYGDGQGISGIKSSDLRNWTVTSPIFPGSPPAWTTAAVPGFAGYFWAPDVAWFNGRYNLYYACSEWGTINSAIGLVTTPSLASPVWTDQGKVIQSNPNFATNATTDLTAYNCIDPSILVDTNGTVWMSFGSYSDGILIMQLDPIHRQTHRAQFHDLPGVEQWPGLFQQHRGRLLPLPARRLLLFVRQLRRLLRRRGQHLQHPRGPQPDRHRTVFRQERHQHDQRRRHDGAGKHRAVTSARATRPS